MQREEEDNEDLELDIDLGDEIEMALNDASTQVDTYTGVLKSPGLNTFHLNLMTKDASR